MELKDKTPEEIEALKETFGIRKIDITPEEAEEIRKGVAQKKRRLHWYLGKLV